MTTIFGAARRTLLDELEAWCADGPPVCVLYGPSGVGKTALANALADRIARKKLPVYEVPLPAGDDYQSVDDDLLFALATGLADQGLLTVANALSQGADAARQAFYAALRTPGLVLLDEGQALFDARGNPHRPAELLFKALAAAGVRPACDHPAGTRAARARLAVGCHRVGHAPWGLEHAQSRPRRRAGRGGRVGLLRGA